MDIAGQMSGNSVIKNAGRLENLRDWLPKTRSRLGAHRGYKSVISLSSA